MSYILLVQLIEWRVKLTGYGVTTVNARERWVEYRSMPFPCEFFFIRARGSRGRGKGRGHWGGGVRAAV